MTDAVEAALSSEVADGASAADDAVFESESEEGGPLKVAEVGPTRPESNILFSEAKPPSPPLGVPVFLPLAQP